MLTASSVSCVNCAAGIPVKNCSCNKRMLRFSTVAPSLPRRRVINGVGVGGIVDVGEGLGVGLGVGVGEGVGVGAEFDMINKYKSSSTSASADIGSFIISLILLIASSVACVYCDVGIPIKNLNSNKRKLRARTVSPSLPRRKVINSVGVGSGVGVVVGVGLGVGVGSGVGLGVTVGVGDGLGIGVI